jgi:subtilisin family serine protease
MPAQPRIRSRLYRCTAALSLGLVAACGGGSGGGGVGTTPAPPSAPAPTPAPAPVASPSPAATTTGMPPTQPVPTEFNTAEFRRSDGPLEHNAAVAWNAGRTGQGVTIAVVDTGVDVNSPEFAGRISPLSMDVLGAGRPISGTDDHGTHVALVAAGARDNVGILGMAFGATVMALRTDTVGSCSSGGPTDSMANCSFSDDNIAAAVTYASTNGARVINISLGGEGATVGLQNAVRDAVARGSLIVLSAGNDGLSQPESFATLLGQAGNGGVLIVGSVDADGDMSSFSNRAGSQGANFLAARGSRICCAYENGQLYTDSQGYVYVISGTSFSAPQVSGAAALLAQAFPNLTGRQIAEILLETAFDVGAPGTDAVYGRGILDLARAFQPLGTTTLAGSDAALPLGDDAGTASPAMGDALATASLQAVVLDRYDRAFGTDLGVTLRGAQTVNRLAPAIAGQQRYLSFGSPQTSLAFTIDASEGPARADALRLGLADADSARVLAARVTSQLAPGLRLGFGYAEGADGLVAQLQGQDRPAFMIAPEAGGDNGMFRRTDASFALRRQFGGWGVTLSAESGETVSGAAQRRAAEMRGRRFEEDVSAYGIALDRRLGSVELALGLSQMDERNTLLGGRFHDAFGLSGARTLFADARLGFDFAPGWRLGGAVRQGWTAANEAGFVTAGSNLVSRAWSIDLERRGVFAGDDGIALRLAQPLRVERGTLNLLLPVGYSYETLLADYGVRSLALAPQGRELLAELAWTGPLFAGEAAASLFYRRDPGHYEALPADQGVALRWSRRF